MLRRPTVHVDLVVPSTTEETTWFNRMGISGYSVAALISLMAGLVVAAFFAVLFFFVLASSSNRIPFSWLQGVVAPTIDTINASSAAWSAAQHLEQSAKCNNDDWNCRLGTSHDSHILGTTTTTEGANAIRIMNMAAQQPSAREHDEAMKMKMRMVFNTMPAPMRMAFPVPPPSTTPKTPTADTELSSTASHEHGDTTNNNNNHEPGKLVFPIDTSEGWDHFQQLSPKPQEPRYWPTERSEAPTTFGSGSGPRPHPRGIMHMYSASF
jgi:hypothetical protein